MQLPYNESGSHTSGPGPRPRVWLHVPVGILWAPPHEDTCPPGDPAPLERAAKAGANLFSPLEMSHTHTPPAWSRLFAEGRAAPQLQGQDVSSLAGRNCVLFDLCLSKWRQLHRRWANGAPCANAGDGGCCAARLWWPPGTCRTPVSPGDGPCLPSGAQGLAPLVCVGLGCQVPTTTTWAVLQS